MLGDQLSDYCLIYIFLQADPDMGSVPVIDKANKELVEVARRGEPSVLRERLFKCLVAKIWMSEVKEELAIRCPVVNSILSVLLDTRHCQDKKEPALCLIYSIIMHLRCHELSRVQWTNSILTSGQASVNVSLKNIISNDENTYCITGFFYLITNGVIL